MGEGLCRRRFSALDLNWIIIAALCLEHGHPIFALLIAFIGHVAVSIAEAQFS